MVSVSEITVVSAVVSVVTTSDTNVASVSDAAIDVVVVVVVLADIAVVVVIDSVTSSPAVTLPLFSSQDASNNTAHRQKLKIFDILFIIRFSLYIITKL